MTVERFPLSRDRSRQEDDAADESTQKLTCITPDDDDDEVSAKKMRTKGVSWAHLHAEVRQTLQIREISSARRDFRINNKKLLLLPLRPLPSAIKLLFPALVITRKAPTSPARATTRRPCLFSLRRWRCVFGGYAMRRRRRCVKNPLITKKVNENIIEQSMGRHFFFLVWFPRRRQIKLSPPERLAN